MTDPRLVTNDPSVPVVTPVDATEPATTHAAESTSKPLIKSGKLYDALKFLALILLPAASAAYFAIDGIIGLPNATGVVGTITAIDLFLGSLVGVSSAQYNSSESKYSGEIQMVENEGKKVYQLILNDDPEILEQAKQVVFKVKKLF